MINNDTYQRETLSELPIRQPLKDLAKSVSIQFQIHMHSSQRKHTIAKSTECKCKHITNSMTYRQKTCTGRYSDVSYYLSERFLFRTV